MIMVKTAAMPASLGFGKASPSPEWHTTSVEDGARQSGIPSLILTDGLFGSAEGKTAHGLLRCGDRFTPLAVLDATSAGLTTAQVIPNLNVDVPIFATVDEAIGECPAISTAVVGVSTPAGRLTESLRRALAECARHSLNLVAGLHDFLVDDPVIAAEAAAHGVTITDVRRPSELSKLHFWDGSIYGVRAVRVAVLGMDCVVGKRTTAQALTQEINKRGRHAEMIYTGQTGWMQGSRYGIVLDALVDDFITGELEHAIVQCDRDLSPDFMIIEGQSGMQNPVSPTGPAILLSADVDAVILHVMPARRKYFGTDVAVKSLESEFTLTQAYGIPVVGVSLNALGASSEDIADVARFCRAHSLPLADPVRDGAGPLAEAVLGINPRER
jgi:uncharacterized NAD-dependent epimerase/dehydratase family protein